MPLFDFMSKELTTSTTNNAAYDLTDASQGAGDDSFVAGRDNVLQVTSTQSDQGAINAGVTLGGMALGTAVNAQTLAANALLSANASQTINADLMRDLARENASTATAAEKSRERAAIAAEESRASAAASLARQQTDSLREALAMAEGSQRNATNFAREAGDNSLAATRAAISAAIGSSSDAIAAGDRAASRAFGFGDDVLQGLLSGNRTAYAFSSDAMMNSLVSSNKAVATAENSLDSGFAFARATDREANVMVSDMIASVIGLVKETSKSTLAESQETRDFAGEFVGDFYESQKSGDVQTIQNIAKYAGVVGVALALAWAIKNR